ncbi:lipopolysaccharide heptosyltransferase II [Desulfonatronum sp. SC1]|uniref:lipopolysaccharide heptosyltransferase II n=1 Tax=Desulfonatronum sp. SC1 TaxID=2109626 RepID=UPI000D31B293|nr:lipopolysaccharide heptosyltransferase II [Desulfonatronum sp. SC1]PTN38906.1 lipopolysaccharide heptosyltransferase II [Desulfonatronum sp. SC1]
MGLSPSRILLVGPSWVGDMVMAQSLVQVLIRRFPGAEVDVLAPAWSAALVARMPGVRRAVTISAGHGRLGLWERLTLARRLHGSYDQAMVLPNSLKSALVPFLARIPRRAGYLGECRYGLLNDPRKLDKHRLPMTVQRFVALGLPKDASHPPDVPAPRLEVHAANVQNALTELNLDVGRDILILCPGAEYGPAKRWPAEHFAEVGRVLAGWGWKVWVMGSARDDETAQTVCELIGPAAVNLAGRTSLAQAVDLISLARAVVSNDSGLMHVAAALNRPLAAIYGSSDPGFTPPLSPTSRVVSMGLKCSPCFQRQCPEGHLNCLRKLTPDRVLDRLAELIPDLDTGRPVKAGER